MPLLVGYRMKKAWDNKAIGRRGTAKNPQTTIDNKAHAERERIANDSHL